MKYTSENLARIINRIHKETYKIFDHPCDHIKFMYKIEQAFYEESDHEDTDLVEYLCNAPNHPEVFK